MMKKDRECLQSMIQRRIDNLPSGYEGLYIEGSRDAYELVLQDIDQLDEPEVLSHKWIERNTSPVDGEGRLYIWKRDLEKLIVPKQELPVVPTWFDKWWKNITKGEGNLLHSIERFHKELYGSGTMEMDHYINSSGNKKKLLNIIINELDYEVEEEPLYQVSAADMRSGFWFLCKDNDGDIMIGTNKDYYRVGWDSLKLTEQEIKDYDHRYMIFAEPLEE